ncbi:hypothetical protein BJ742DRAFT_346334 [Cladochytrium replicatum]|nr:hypothetical protein BJ742DRAFT_346334 [Cladochytrium replicatum]
MPAESERLASSRNTRYLSDELDILGGISLPNCPYFDSQLPPLSKSSAPQQPPAPVLSLWFTIYNPVTTLTFLAIAITCIAFAIYIPARINTVRVFNRKINDPTVKNGWWALFFGAVGTSFLIDSIRYCSNLPRFSSPGDGDLPAYSIAGDDGSPGSSTGGRRRDPPTWSIEPKEIDAWLLLTSALFRSVSVMFLSFALDHQRKYRSEDRRKDPSILFSPTIAYGSGGPSSSSSLRASVYANYGATSHVRSSVSGVPQSIYPSAPNPVSYHQRSNPTHIPPSPNSAYSAHLHPSAAASSSYGSHPSSSWTASILAKLGGNSAQQSGSGVGGGPLMRRGSAASTLSSSSTTVQPSQGRRGNAQRSSVQQYTQPTYDTEEEELVRHYHDDLEDPFAESCAGCCDSMWAILKDVVMSWTFIAIALFALNALTLVLSATSSQSSSDGSTSSQAALFTFSLLTTVLQRAPPTLLSYHIITTKPRYPLPQSSTDPLTPSSPHMGISTSMRSARRQLLFLRNRRNAAHGASRNARVVLFFAVLLGVCVWLEPSVVSRGVREAVRGEAGTFESRMCVVPPWWWRDVRGDGEGFGIGVAGGERYDGGWHGWASWVDGVHWVGLGSLWMMFWFVNMEYVRNSEEWVWVILSQLQDQYDFRA